MTGIEKAVQSLGSQYKLAKKLDVSPQVVNYWYKIKRVPAERVLAIEAATGGEVTRHDLRPDLYPDDPDDAA